MHQAKHAEQRRTKEEKRFGHVVGPTAINPAIFTRGFSPGGSLWRQPADGCKCLASLQACTTTARVQQRILPGELLSFR
jgi:hypothetical protein